MKRFRFPLDRLRELRERLEREAAATLGLAMRAREERREALALAHVALQRATEQVAGAAGAGAVAAGLLQNMERARDAAEQRVEAGIAALAAAELQVDAARVRYDEAHRDLKVLEKLKEKRLEAWREETAREEQRETDSVALGRHAAKGDRP